MHFHCSLTGSLIIRVAYGYEAKRSDDPILEMEEYAAGVLTHAVSQGKFLVVSSASSPHVLRSLLSTVVIGHNPMAQIRTWLDARCWVQEESGGMEQDL